MATESEILAFHEDQRHLVFQDAADAARLALRVYEFPHEDGDRLLSVSAGEPEWINYMSRDANGKLLWIHGEHGYVKLTYLASEWSQGFPV